MGRKHNAKHLPLSRRRYSMKKGWIRRRRMLRLEKKMEREANNTENKTIESSTKLLNNTFNKEKKQTNDERREEIYNEESTLNKNIEYCDDNKDFIFVNVDNIGEKEEYIEEGTFHDILEFEDNKDLIFSNINNLEKAKDYRKQSMYSNSIECSTSKNNVNIHDSRFVNAFPSIHENIPIGRCIINFSFVWSEIHRTYNNHSRKVLCQFKYWKLIKYRRSGLLTQFFFKCQICHYETSIWSEPIEKKTPDINVAAVTAGIITRLKPFQLKHLFASMNIVYGQLNLDNFIKTKKTVTKNIKNGIITNSND